MAKGCNISRSRNISSCSLYSSWNICLKCWNSHILPVINSRGHIYCVFIYEYTQDPCSWFWFATSLFITSLIRTVGPTCLNYWTFKTSRFITISLYCKNFSLTKWRLLCLINAIPIAVCLNSYTIIIQNFCSRESPTFPLYITCFCCRSWWNEFVIKLSINSIICVASLIEKITSSVSTPQLGLRIRKVYSIPFWFKKK